jgi:hypothetical protein
MLVHSYYEEDPRVRRQAETLVATGRPVDVFSLRRPGDPSEGTLAGVRITRLDVQRHQGSPIATYLAEYSAFLVRAAFAVARAHRRRYALVRSTRRRTSSLSRRCPSAWRASRSSWTSTRRPRSSSARAGPARRTG